MNFKDFFLPIQRDCFNEDDLRELMSSQLGAAMVLHIDTFPNLDDSEIRVALIGVPEDRNSVNNFGCALASNSVRKQLYELHQGANVVKIVDLGDLKQGKTVNDSYFALKMVLAELMQKCIVPVIIGGSQDLTYAQYLAYENMESKVEAIVVDSRIDFDLKNLESPVLNSHTFLNSIFLHEPSFLFNLRNLGYQSYFVSQDCIRAMEQMQFETLRLGEITSNLQLVEPIIRSANMISLDIGAIRSADAVANANKTPNGFSGQEACQICRYAGMSDKLSSIGFYEYNPKLDNDQQSAMLMAQMIWYFIEGVGLRKSDFPSLNSSEYIIYRCSVKEHEYEIVFVKSTKSDRWWMQVPYSTATFNELYHWMPCTYDDYLTATEGDMPNLWWKTYQKLQ